MNPQVKKAHYYKGKYDDLNRFISYSYQVDLARDLAGEGSKILEVGKGNGTVSDYLRKLGLSVKTADFDANLKPDFVADIRKLPFGDGEFDIVTACEVLEHIPFEDFQKGLLELKRVSRKNILISLPYRSTGFEFILRLPFIRTIFGKLFLDFFLRIPLKFGGIETSGQHYWEIDFNRYSLRKIRRIIKKHFKVIKEVRPVLNHYHYFFVLEKL